MVVFSGDTSPLPSLSPHLTLGRNYQIIPSASSQPRVEMGSQSVCQLISSENWAGLVIDKTFT